VADVTGAGTAYCSWIVIWERVDRRYAAIVTGVG